MRIRLLDLFFLLTTSTRVSFMSCLVSFSFIFLLNFSSLYIFLTTIISRFMVLVLVVVLQIDELHYSVSWHLLHWIISHWCSARDLSFMTGFNSISSTFVSCCEYNVDLIQFSWLDFHEWCALMSGRIEESLDARSFNSYRLKWFFKHESDVGWAEIVNKCQVSSNEALFVC